MAKNTRRNKDDERPNGGASINLALSQKRKTALGLFFIVLAILFLIAFGSQIFTGDADYSIMAGNESLAEGGGKVKNKLGFVGAFVSYYFINRWFGIASFLLIPILFFAGIEIAFGKRIINLARRTWESLFYIIWTSIFFGYFVHLFEAENGFGKYTGGIGYSVGMFLHQLVGWPSIIIILLALALFFIFFYEITSVEAFNDKFGVRRIKNPFAAEETVTEKTPYRRNQENWEEELDEPAFAPKTSTVVNTPVVQLPTIEDEDDVFESNPIENKPAGGFSFTIAETPVEPEAEIEPTPQERIQEEDRMEELAEDLVEEFGQYDPTLDLGNYKFPTLDLLTEHISDKASVTNDELEANSKRIVETLGNYGIGIQSIKATIGPTVTLYEIIPDAGVRISKIKNLEDDIALSLAALGIRIIAPIPGKGTIGIEVPNKNKEMVAIRSLFASEKFQKSTMELPVVLGKTISNEIFMTDLAKMPHLLMAGATGQGKSVGLNVIIASLIYKKHPSQLKFVMVDPKKVELTLFNKLERHFLAMLPGEAEPIITNTKKVVNTLNSLCIEMDNRYNLLKDAGCRNLKEYNSKFINRKLSPEKGHKYLPYIVLVIDELADLMMTAGKEVEQPIARLAQLARAVGIHLIVATQRPSVNVITGLIKANFPARLSFKVTSKIDSRTILDAGGADQLVGQGDMLLSTGSDLTRIQCAFIDTPEVDEVCDYIGAQNGYASAYMLPEFEGDESGEEKSDFDPENRDPYFDEAARLIVNHQQGSTSLIQRRMKLGYNRAGRLIDQLEAAGIVGPFEGSKAREVLVHSIEELEEFLKKL
jgi:DNA segregation ATPase FtsK/SpoIIIE, S-DNA-T family